MSHKFSSVLTIVVAGMCFAGNGSAATEMVSNGSFDSFPRYYGGTGFNPAEMPTGWTGVGSGLGFLNSYGGNLSPDGGQYFGVQGTYTGNQGGLKQTINGLTVGVTYNVSFLTMANHTNSGGTQGWDVSLGSSPAQAGVRVQTNATWAASSLSFTANAASEVLTFMMHYNAPSYPEVLNLDGIHMTMTAVPEPSSYALMLGGMGILATMMRRRSKKQA